MAVGLINLGMMIVEQMIPIIAPLITPYIVEALSRGEDPALIDWTKLYARSAADLKAEVNAQLAREERE